MGKAKENHNDHIFTLDEIKAQCRLFKDYSKAELFSYFGKLIPDTEREKLILKTDLQDKRGNVYAIVVDGYLFKAGKTDVTMGERIRSYNSGKRKHRESGTCSTANYMVLQTLLNINKEIELYVMTPPKAKLEIFGKIVEIDTSPAKYLEGIIIKDIEEEFGEKPLGDVQS